MESKEQVKKKWDFCGLSWGFTLMSIGFICFHDVYGVTLIIPALMATISVVAGVIGLCKKESQKKVKSIISILSSTVIIALVSVAFTKGVANVKYPLIKIFNNSQISNINTVIDEHIAMRDAHPGENIFTSFTIGGEWKGIQLMSGPDAPLLLNVFFNNGYLQQQMEHERFKQSKYYSYFFNNTFENYDYGYSLVLNADKQTCVDVLTDILINVFKHPANTDVSTSTFQ